MALNQICGNYRLYGTVAAVVFNLAIFVIYGYSTVGNSKPLGSRQIRKHAKHEEYPTDIEHGVLKDVYYLWCGNDRWFDFRHYLSVRSVFLHLQPYRVRILCEYEPKVHEVGPYTWLTELRQEYAFFSLSYAPLPEKWCANKQQTVDNYLSKQGGIYIHEEVILAGPFDELWVKSFDSVRIVDEDSNSTLIQISRRGKNSTTSFASTTSTRFLSGSARSEDCRNKTATVEIISPGNLPITSPIAEDSAMLFKAEAQVFSEYIWELDSEAGRLLRTAASGKPDITRPVPDYSRLAPNIAHVVWSNNDTMKFEFYLCVLSLLEVAKFDKVYIHGDGPPSGRYWSLLKDHPNLRLVHRTLIDGDKEHIYGNEVKKMAHVTDVLRVDIMNRYGGLYVDTDAIFFRPLTRELRAYDAVVAPDIAQGLNEGFPNVYQNGIMLGKPGAKFWRLYLESMKKYYDDNWLWNSNYALYRIKERHPGTLLNFPRLNTICFDGVCHPYWEQYMYNISKEQTVEIMKDWQNSTFAIQNCGPQVALEHSSPDSLLKSNGTTLFGALGMYVLEKAGKLDFFRKACRQDATLCWTA